MKEYQLFILTLEGSVKEQYALKCADDTDARKRAKKFLTTYAVELWDGPRRVVRLPSKIFERSDPHSDERGCTALDGSRRFPGAMVRSDFWRKIANFWR